jgi:hypothetical protein
VLGSAHLQLPLAASVWDSAVRRMSTGASMITLRRHCRTADERTLREHERCMLRLLAVPPHCLCASEMPRCHMTCRRPDAGQSGLQPAGLSAAVCDQKGCQRTCRAAYRLIAHKASTAWRGLSRRLHISIARPSAQPQWQPLHHDVHQD